MNVEETSREVSYTEWLPVRAYRLHHGGPTGDRLHWGPRRGLRRELHRKGCLDRLNQACPRKRLGDVGVEASPQKLLSITG